MTGTGEELLRSLRLAEAELADTRGQIAAAENALADLQGQLTLAEDARKDILQYNADIKANNLLLEETNGQLAAQGNRLRAEHADLQRRTDALRYELAASKAELSALA